MAEEPGQKRNRDSKNAREKAERDAARREIEERHAARGRSWRARRAPPPPDPFLVDALGDARRDAQFPRRRRGGARATARLVWMRPCRSWRLKARRARRPRRGRGRGGAAGLETEAAARETMGAKKRWLHERGYGDATPKDHDGDARRALAAVQLGKFPTTRTTPRPRRSGATSARPSRRFSATI